MWESTFQSKECFTAFRRTSCSSLVPDVPWFSEKCIKLKKNCWSIHFESPAITTISKLLDPYNTENVGNRAYEHFNSCPAAILVRFLQHVVQMQNSYSELNPTALWTLTHYFTLRFAACTTSEQLQISLRYVSYRDYRTFCHSTISKLADMMLNKQGGKVWIAITWLRT